MGAVGRKRTGNMADAMDTPEDLPGKRNRAAADSMDTSDDLPLTQEARCREGALHVAFVADKDKVKHHTQWWGPGMRAHWDANQAPPVDGVDAAISVRAAECEKSLGRELSGNAGDLCGSFGSCC